MMRYWLQLPQGGWVANRDNVRLYALLAEEIGFQGLWLGDHIVIPVDYTSQYPYAAQHPVPSDRPFLEAYTTLSYIAGMTERVRLAVTVAIAPYRHPLLHAKIVATLDHLSNGRLEVGVGTGWLEEEFLALGADYSRRGKVTNEYLDAMCKLWSGQPVAFNGETVKFKSVQCLPMPTQQPHPPLWIGGAGPRAIARIVRFNAGWLGPDLPLSQFLAHSQRLTQECAVRGRGPSRISAKLWVERPQDRSPDSLSFGSVAPTNFELLRQLESAGTTDVRIDLSRLPSGDRPQHILALARALRKEGHLQ